MQLFTPRLILREIELGDSAALQGIYADRQALRYEVSLEEPLDEAVMQERIRRILADQASSPRTRYRFAITIRPEDRLVGWISLRLTSPRIREWEMGWSVCRSAWNQGYATEAAAEVMRYAFRQLNAHRLAATCHIENTAFERVMQKLGMQMCWRIFTGRTRIFSEESQSWMKLICLAQIICSIQKTSMPWQKASPRTPPNTMRSMPRGSRRW